MIQKIDPRLWFTSGAARIVLGALLLCAIALAALPSLERQFLIRAGEEAQATLRLSVEGLEGALQRFEPLPGLIGERPNLRDLLLQPGDDTLRVSINEELRATAENLGASDIYLLDRDGLTIATSNYLKERSFMGRRFAFRPYFTQAIDGDIGRYFALGTTSLERGYFYAAPVYDGQTIVGALTLKFTVDAFEDAWRGGAYDIIVSDLNGIVFMANREDWHFRTLAPLNNETLSEIAETQQYPLDELVPLENTRSILTPSLDMLQVTDAGTAQVFVSSTTALDQVGWAVSILVPAGPAKAQALITLFVAVLVVLIVGLVFLNVRQRRARIMERLEAQRAAQDLLERRVEERTADLNAANAHLRKTQHDLVQAGKLAALGQMSAALSHEINQPLAAVKTYAANAATFLERQKVEDARDNVSRISQLADRMASISGHLRNFARRPQDDVGPIDVRKAIDDALAIMEPRLKASKATVVYEAVDDPLWVLGGQLRLQQVIINLMNNALDAMEDQAKPTIDLEVDDGATDEVSLRVLDRGEGLDEETLAQLFDPFFTTKSPGKGLGLGLSISYNIVEDFGGHLRAENRPDGGAVFSIVLQRAQAPDLASDQGVAAE